MTFRRGAFLLLLAGGVVWVTTVRRSDFGSHPDAQSPAVPAQARPAPVPTAGTEVQDGEAATDTASAPEPPGPVLPKPRTVALAAAEQTPTGLKPGEPGSGLSPLTSLENMRSTFRQYSSRLGGNPVGDNAEITAALNGRNARQVVFLNPDEDGVRMNEHGELVDSWNTPYFFHQLSRTEMEIRSAGPDRRMWTADDLVIK
jgi:hypothetical protein